MIRVIRHDDMDGRCPICLSFDEFEHDENCQTAVMSPLYSKINHPSYDLNQHYPRRRSAK